MRHNMEDTGTLQMHLTLQQEIPNYSVFQAAQALRNKFRQQIFSLLTTRNNLSFNDFLQNLNIARPKLAYHLQILTEQNIIKNFYDKREGVKDHSFYELSSFGRELFTGSPPTKNVQQQITEQESNEQMQEPPDMTSNFRTVQQAKYKSYEHVPLKRTEHSLLPIKQQVETEYIEPMLNCKIVTKPGQAKSTKKVTLPTFRKYYLSYKHPFKLE